MRGQLCRAAGSRAKRGRGTHLPSDRGPLGLRPLRFELLEDRRVLSVLSVPFVHQTYDTGDSFNGVAGCAPTSAVMLLAYHGRLAQNPIWTSAHGSTPGHYNDYGFYVSNSYTYSSHTFSYVATQATRAGPASGAGAWGFIWKDGNTRTNLINYLGLHDLSVSFTANPSQAVAQNIVRSEIDAGRPVIAQTYLTELGHYVVIAGYSVQGDGTLLYKVNDPYGEQPYSSDPIWGDSQWEVAQPVTYTYAQMGLGVQSRGLITAVSTLDTTRPESLLSASNVTTAGAATYTFSVTYTDNVAVNVSSLDGSDLVVSGPSGFSQAAAYVSVNNTSNGSPRTATYQINTPGGTWDSADNGTYTVTMQRNQVSDRSGNYALSGALGTFTVNVPPPADTTRPQSLLSASNVTTAGAATYTFSVTYTDNVAVNVSSLDGSDLVVSGPSGFSQAAAYVSVNNTSNGSPRTATYQINTPGGTWDSADNGTYTVTMQPNQVSDNSGNYALSGALGTFTVNIPTVVGPLVQFRLETTDMAGAPIAHVRQGGSFLLRVCVQDVRPEAVPNRGVFQAYVDVTFDNVLVTALGPLSFADAYKEQDSGSLTPGLVDEAGGTQTGFGFQAPYVGPLGPGEFLLFSVPFQAVGPGTVTFASDPADLVIDHDVTLFQPMITVPTDDIVYGTTALTVTAGWRNPINPLDVNGDRVLAPQDVLFLANFLYFHGQRAVPQGPGTAPFPVAPPPYYDVNGDDFVTVQDALLIVTALRNRPAPEGEGGQASVLARSTPLLPAGAVKPPVAVDLLSGVNGRAAPRAAAAGKMLAPGPLREPVAAASHRAALAAFFFEETVGPSAARWGLCEFSPTEDGTVAFGPVLGPSQSSPSEDGNVGFGRTMEDRPLAAEAVTARHAIATGPWAERTLGPSRRLAAAADQIMAGDLLGDCLEFGEGDWTYER